MVRQVQILIFLSLFIFTLLGIGSVNAVTFPQSTEAILTHPVRVNGGITPGVTCNVSVFYPNNTILVDFLKMDDNKDHFAFNLSTSDTSIKGDYNYDVTCLAPSGLNDTSSFSYIVNLGGVEPSEQRTNAITTMIYFIFGIGILLFIGFFFSRQLTIKWSFLLVGLLFVLIAINMIFISLQDEIINPKLETFFSGFTTISYIMYWFIGFLLATIWIVSFFVTVFKNAKDSEIMRNAR